jgi:hypothetical protein
MIVPGPQDTPPYQPVNIDNAVGGNEEQLAVVNTAQTPGAIRQV